MKTKSLKRFVSGLLAALMVFALLPAPAWGMGYHSGTCGPNATWSKEGELGDGYDIIISGTGEVTSAPWLSRYLHQIRSVTVENGITSLCDEAFKDCEFLEEVSLPNSLTSIGKSVFDGCERLSSITIPSGITNISEWAFYGCEKLSSVTIPSGVTNIDKYAFYGCTGMTRITIPASVTNIEPCALMGCDSLTSILVDANNPNYSNNSRGVLLNKDKTTLILCPGGLNGSYTIPDSVTYIGAGAFSGCNLTHVTIPNSVTGVGRGVFTLSEKLSSVTLGRGMTSIGAAMFWGCKNLKEFTIPRGYTTICEDAFWECTGLREVTIPVTVVSIEYSAFRLCKYIADVYYGGTENQWNAIQIGAVNNALTNATIHFGKTIDPPVLSAGNVPETGAIQLSWDAVDGAEKYLVCRGVDATTFRSMDTVTTTTYTDNSVTPGTEYYYFVQAVNEKSEESDISNIVSCTAACERPTISNCTGASTGGVRLDWEAVNGAVEYLVYRRTPDERAYRMLDRTTETGYNDVGATPGSRYYYKLVAVAEGGKRSDYSNAAATVAICAAPKVSSSNVSTGGIKLTWSAVNGAGGYYIHRSTDGKNYTIYDSTTGTTYTDKDVTPGQTYYYKLITACAATSDGNSLLSNAAYRTADCAAPKVSSSNVSTGGIKLTWNAVNGASKYNIYRCTDGENYKFYDSTTKTTYTNKSVTPGQTYYYKLVAVCGKSSYGNSAYSNVASRTADCIAPKVSSSNVSTGGIKLTWSAVDGASKYYIYRCTDGENYKFYDSTTKTTYTNKSVTPGQTYYYKLVAVCGKSSYGNSAYSNVASRTADCVTPTLTIQLSSGGKPQLKWNAIDGASKYYIYRSTDGKNFSFFDSTTRLSYTNTGAKSGTTYYYKLVAVCAKSTYGNSAYSNIVSIKSK